jgi:hypothetical protein
MADKQSAYEGHLSSVALAKDEAIGVFSLTQVNFSSLSEGPIAEKLLSDD